MTPEFYVAPSLRERIAQQARHPDISLSWLIEPEISISTHTGLIDRMNEAERQEYPESLARLRHTAEFLGRIARLIPPHVRIWLQGWSAAFVHAAFARAVGLAPPE